MKKLLLIGALLFLTTAPVIAQEVQNVEDSATQTINEAQYTMRIDGLTCPFCVATSEKALKKIDGVKGVTSGLKEGTITVCANSDNPNFTDKKMTALFLEKGFTYKGMETAEQCQAL
jgi:mercuric ion binding protein